MKSSLSILLLAGMILAGCSDKSTDSAAKLLINPVKGMRADEVMAAHNVAAVVLPAIATHKNDPGLETVNKQMTAFASGLQTRAQLLMAVQAPPGSNTSATSGPNANGLTVQQQLDANTVSLSSILATARTSVDSVGGSKKRIAGMQADTLQSSLRASLDRIGKQFDDIVRASPDKAIPEIAALRARLGLSRLNGNGRAMPTISVRKIHP